MRRTLTLIAVSLATLCAAALLVLRSKPVHASVGVEDPPPASTARAGALNVSAQLDRRYVSEQGGGEAYLEINVLAAGAPGAGDEGRVPVNAVLIIDRSGSMTGEKLQRAKDAARELLQRLNGDDRFALIDFGSDARVLVPSMAATAAAKETALGAVQALRADGGTNLSAAIDLAAPQLAQGHAPGRVDKIFLASDGQANEGVSERHALLAYAARSLAGATVSTFGVGADYDEDLMTGLATQAGGMTWFIRTGEELVPAFRTELAHAAHAVAREVRLVVTPQSGARVERVIGYEADGGSVRLPDFAAGERRRVLVKLSLPSGRGTAQLARVELQFAGTGGGVQRAQTFASAIFTADERLAARRSAAQSYEGARAELNDLGREAADLAASGQRVQAEERVSRMRALRAFASRNAASAKEKDQVAQDLSAFESALPQIAPAPAGAPAPAAAKAAKQAAFDHLRASY